MRLILIGLKDEAVTPGLVESIVDTLEHIQNPWLDRGFFCLVGVMIRECDHGMSCHCLGLGVWSARRQSRMTKVLTLS